MSESLKASFYSSQFTPTIPVESSLVSAYIFLSVGMEEGVREDRFNIMNQ